MKRREFIATLGGAAAWPLAARAQPAKLPTVGLLIPGTPASFGQRVAACTRRLRELGWIEGRTIAIEYRWAEAQRFDEIVNEFVRLKVDVIVTAGTPPTIAAQKATSSIPIVFVAAGDPVGTGLVASLARPGGNVTGLTAVFADLTGKWLEFLKEMLPTLTRVALLSRPANPGHVQYVQQAQMAARILRVELEVMSANGPEEFEVAFHGAQGVGALIQIDDAMFTSHRQKLVELATRHRVPGAYGLREFVDIGGFMALGPSYPELYRRSAAYLDKIFKGAKPADLPVEQANKFEIIINLKTAKALGLEVPPTLLARADEVIE
jgi:putative ABC transport system substrate-binding protein